MLQTHVEEFQRLVSAFQPPGLEHYTHIIQRLVAVTDAKAGAFWNCEQRPFVPMAYHSAGEAARLGFSQNDHDRILSQVIEQRRSAVVRAAATAGQDSPIIFFAPIKGQSKRCVELVFPGHHRIGDSRAFLQELNSLCEVFQQLDLPADPSLESSRSKDSSAGQRDLSVSAFSRYLHTLHSSIDRRLTCANIANETLVWLDCDRVSVVLRQRGRFRIVAISGQPMVNRRSNTVQTLERLAAEVLKAKTQLWYPTESEIVPQIKSILDEYLVSSAVRSLVIHPITGAAATPSEDPEIRERANDSIIGGIIYEHNREQWSYDLKANDLALTTQHGGDALRNACQHQQLFLYPLWRWLGKSKLMTSPAAISKSLLMLLALVSLGLFLAFWPASFYVSASGVLVPEHRQLIFPRTTGEVVSVQVDHGQPVKPGETLVVLRSEDLQLRIEDVSGRIETLKQRRSAMERSKFKNGPAAGMSTGSIDENLGALQAEIDSLERQAAGLARMQAELQVVSPVAGQVITWDVQTKLSGRTVTPQNVLMEIADTQGPWQLELDLEDRRIEHLMRGLESAPDGTLAVKFTLAADPSQTYEGTVSEVSRAIQLGQDGQQMMRVKVEIDEDVLLLKQARTSVSAKIYTGETTSLGYLWLHEIPRALKRYVFFYFAG